MDCGDYRRVWMGRMIADGGGGGLGFIVDLKVL